MTASRNLIVFMTICIVAANLLISASAAESKTFSVEGSVLAPDGSASPSALVEARDPWADYKVAGTADADASGKYKLSLPAGKYYLAATSGTLVYFNTEIVEVKSDGTVTGPRELKLEKGCTVAGSVIDKTTSKPLSGAKVLTRWGNHTETGPDGGFALVLEKGSHTLTIVKDGFWRPIIHINCSGQDTVSLTIETKPEGVIKGRVTDDNGQPIKGAKVASSESGNFKFDRSETNEKGEYVLDGLDPGIQIRVSAYADGYRSAYKEQVIFPQGQREVSVDLRLAAEKHRALSGIVVKAAGKPIEGATVSYGWAECYANFEKTQTDKSGKFSLKEVDCTKNVVLARKPGFAPSFAFVEADATPQLKLVLQPGHSLEGKIVDEEGNTIEGAHVSASVTSDELQKLGFCGQTNYDYYESDESDKEGHFKLQNLPADRVYLEAYARGYTQIREVPIAVDKKDHVITIKKLGSICGMVVGASDGQPIPQFKIYLDFPNNSQPGDVCTGLSPGLVEQGTSFNSADGKFELSRMNTGETLRVVAEAPGYMRQAVDRVLIEPESKADFSKLVFRLPQAINFQGVVTDIEGKPISDVLVTLLDTSSPWGWFNWRQERSHSVSARTDDQGKFLIENAPALRGSILCEKSGYGRMLLRGVKLSEPLEIGLANGATISGIVKDNAGKPVAGAYVRITHQSLDIEFSPGSTDSGGRFVAADLPLGRYGISRYTDDPHGRRFAEVEVAAGQEHEVDWNRVGEVVVEGKVTLGGKPREDVAVQANSWTGREVNGLALSDKSGAYSFSTLTPGDYKITWSVGEWMDPNHIWVTQRHCLAKGKNRIDIALPDASVTGKVFDRKTGKPISNVTVRGYVYETEAEHSLSGEWSWQHTEPQWWPEKQAKTDSHGRFQLSNHTPGKWMATIQDDKLGRCHCVPFQVREGEKKQGVMIKVPQSGEARVAVVDDQTGKPIDKPYAVCKDQAGFSYYPETDDSCAGGACGIYATKVEDGAVVFANLPPGRYQAFTQTMTKSPASAAFDVKAGKKTEVTIRLYSGSKIVFRLMESAEDPVPGLPWVGYRVKKPGSDKPVLVDPGGPTWGGVLFFKEGSPREVSMPIAPGTYEVEAVLRQENQSGVLGSEANLWSGTQTVTVEEHKDAVIEIPWGEQAKKPIDKNQGM
jgi:protocatechuate 3,4-dioxygenase beta subunit